MRAEPISLLESILWNDGYHHLDKHLQRLSTSTHYLHYPFQRAEVLAQLTEQSAQFQACNLYKVRLLLNNLGHIHIETVQIQKPQGRIGVPSSVLLSSISTDSQAWYYYHKTTHRPLYERATYFAHEHDYADIIFFNEKGEITEGAISNIYVSKEGYLVTPPLHCGALNGIYRQFLLESHLAIKEEILYPADLLNADTLFISNAIRGLRQVVLSSGSATF